MLVERLPEHGRPIAFDFCGFCQSEVPRRWSCDEEVLVVAHVLALDVGRWPQSEAADEVAVVLSGRFS